MSNEDSRGIRCIEFNVLNCGFSIAILMMIAFLFGCSRADATKQPAAQPPAPSTVPSGAGTELNTMDVAQAVMVTVELDFGPKPPKVADALREIERRYQPDDPKEMRTFAILDADGWALPDGKLHLQMHVSSERPGMGWIIFRRTGDVLWSTRIKPTTMPFKEKQLTVLMDNGKGSGLLIDGSNNPASILIANVKELSKPVQDVWPDGSDREFTFTYSACGCPVKAMVHRQGDRTIRTASKRLDGSARDADLPVMFPDDPAVVGVISRLMRW